MTEEELLAEIEKLRREIGELRSTIARVAEHGFGGQISGLLSMLGAEGSYSDWPGRQRPDLVPEYSYTPPARPPEDSLPRGGRNPRIFCEQHESGTWIHGRPHNCPPWARR